MEGWIKLHRKIVDWEWYDDVPTKSLFIHLMILANHKENKWRGQVIEKGSLVTSISSLSQQTGLSRQEVRTALKHLEKTGEINKQTTNHNTLIIVLNYARYQELESDEYLISNTQSTNTQHTPNKQLTTNKNDNNDKNDKNNLTISKDIVCQTETVRPDVQPILNAWNSLSKDTAIKPVSKISTSSKRYQSLCARIKEYGEDKILTAIENIKDSDFLQGKSKDWIITFDWFVRPNNFPKVFEGNYDNRGGNNKYMRY